MMYTRDGLLSDLKYSVLEVIFTKADGTIRKMKATLKSDVLPPVTDLKEAHARKNEDTIAVWDLEAAGWRSFRIDSVISAQILDNY